MGRPYYLVNREHNGKPSLISMVEIPPNLRPNLPYLVLAEVAYRSQENGLPENGELTRLYNIEEGLMKVLSKDLGEHIGHITHDGIMAIAFHCPNPGPDLAEVKLGLFKRVSIPLVSRSDAGWTWFNQELQLTPIEIEISQNRALLDTIAHQGDNPYIPRPVDFAAFFPSETTRQAFVDQVAPHGYELTTQGCWTAEVDHNPFGCEIFVQTTIEAETVAKRCAYLGQTASECGGEFDGWATPIEK